MENILEQVLEICERVKINGNSWQELSEEVKLQYLSEVANIVASGYVQQTIDKDIENAVKVDAEQLPHGHRASSEIDRIVFNVDETIPYQNLSFYAAVHEAVHYGQRRVAELASPGFSRETDLLRSAILSSDAKESVGIPTLGRAYVQPPKAPYNEFTDIDLRTAFYRTAFLERQSHAEEMQIMEQFGESTTKIQNRLNKDLAVLRDRYNCTELTDAEMYELIDRAQEHIANGTTPTNVLEASVTYDMAALMYEQNLGLYKRNPQRHISNCAKLFDPIQKAERLGALGFEQSMTIPKSKFKDYPFGWVALMGPEARRQNPHLVAHIVAKHGKQAAKLVDKESFDSWYFSDNNDLDQKSIEAIAKALGEDYRDPNKDIDLTNLDILVEPDNDVKAKEKKEPQTPGNR